MTGCCGFIGSNVINYLCKKYPNINFYNYDRLDYAATLNNIDVSDYKNYKFFEGDINDKSFVKHILKSCNIDTIIHFAAQTHVDNSFVDSIEFTKDNVLGTHTLIDCANSQKIKKFIHISTDEVYGEVDDQHEGCSEKSLLNPTNPYAASKAGAEFICRSYYYSFGFPVIFVRSNNVYGPRQYPEKIVPKFIYRLKNGLKCQIHGTGKTKRTFVHTEDFAKAIDLILFKGEINAIYNIGTNNEFSVLEIAEKLIKIMKNEDASKWIEYVTDRKFNDYRYCVNSDTLRNLGWKELIDFDKGLKQVVDWYLNIDRNYFDRAEKTE